jgi:isopentenyl-diphosphate Delta-isomerase
MQEQMMVLVNEQDEQIGLLEKTATHEQGLLHRAFSVFLFNTKGEMLMQKRALSKYHSPGLWSNACCSHPLQNEQVIDAASRRLQEELGIKTELTYKFNFIYKAELDNGLTEHEFDHVFTGVYEGQLNLNKDEVDSITYISIEDLKTDIDKNPFRYTAWFKIAILKFDNIINHQ